MFLLVFSFVVEFFAAFTGLFRRKHLENKGLRFFPVFLFIQFLNILASSLYTRVFQLGFNLWMYNIFMVFDMLCFSYFFYYQFDSPKLKKVTVFISILFVVFYTINLLFIQDFFKYFSNSRSLMGGNLIVFSLLYFFQLFNNPKMVEDITRKAQFWIVIGIFFFYLTSTVIMGSLNYLITIYAEISKYYNHSATIKYLAMSLYSFYIIGFLCHKSEKT
jgi:hypothetical protein